MITDAQRNSQHYSSLERLKERGGESAIRGKRIHDIALEILRRLAFENIEYSHQNDGESPVEGLYIETTDMVKNFPDLYKEATKALMTALETNPKTSPFFSTGANYGTTIDGNVLLFQMGSDHTQGAVEAVNMALPELTNILRSYIHTQTPKDMMLH